ncbi:hypothetical protein A7L45_11095 [Clostridium estertheticum subsp. estertheticum]|uniref:Uncharacterized protein n=2 Tax=Clostridium estertheticum TaxID=238834 RepID=A0A1J0GGT7_9CLOT|nr:hypothetical protein A7L45_11095 [Clostridium estertheticum subsp. estertheticum]
MSSPLDYLISAAKGALVGALCGAMFGPAMAGTSLFAAETTGQLALNFVKTLFIGGAENSTYYALNELANFRMPNLGEQLNQFKNGVLFTGLFTGGAKALETAVPWIKKGASTVMDNIEKNVNKFGKYIDDLVPAKAVTPDGQIVYIKNDPIKSGGGGKKVELNKQQKDYNKAVEENKNSDKGAGKDPDYVKDNRVPLDKETVLGGKDYNKTSIKVKGAQVYKKGEYYYYRDTFHTGEASHLEVFDKRGKHVGEANPQTGGLISGTADPIKKINVK